MILMQVHKYVYTIPGALLALTAASVKQLLQERTTAASKQFIGLLGQLVLWQ
jgi:hypothetical protein